MKSIKITLKELELLIKNKHDVRIDTPSGKELITDTYRKFQTGKNIIFDDSSNMICADKHLVLIDDKWTSVDSLRIGQYVGKHRIKEIIDVEAQEWIDFTIDANHESYYHNEIIHHNSGKSLTIYSCIKSVLDNVQKILLIVPNISLVHQMYDDFESYGCDVKKLCHKIYSGQEKKSKKKIIISTWQSIFNNDPEYFQQFDMVIGDECHQCTANSLTNILNSCVNARYKIGATGSLDDSKTNELVLTGLFGNKFIATKTINLINKGQLSDIDIKCILLKYTNIDKNIEKLKYNEEIEFLAKNSLRNQFITKLALSLNGNTLVLFNLIEKHGNILHKLLKKSNKTVYYIHGTVSAEERELIRKKIETEKNCIILASYGTFSTGVNAPSIHNIIFASAYKSKVKVIQSIGRGLRRAINKSKMTLYDIADDLRMNNHVNHTLSHFYERMKIYDKENFKYKIFNIKLRKNESTSKDI